jgi:hypothetical protein
MKSPVTIPDAIYRQLHSTALKPALTVTQLEEKDIIVMNGSDSKDWKAAANELVKTCYPSADSIDFEPKIAREELASWSKHLHSILASAVVTPPKTKKSKDTVNGDSKELKNEDNTSYLRAKKRRTHGNQLHSEYIEPPHQVRRKYVSESEDVTVSLFNELLAEM